MRAQLGNRPLVKKAKLLGSVWLGSMLLAIGGFTAGARALGLGPPTQAPAERSVTSRAPGGMLRANVTKQASTPLVER